MIPEQNINLTELQTGAEPSLTYKLDVDTKRITSKIDNKEAITQAVMKILNTERYAHVIYSSQYGVEIEKLLGQDYDFILADLKRTITEAIMVDDRITSITEFNVSKVGVDALAVSFVVHSVFGSDRINVEVQVL